MGGHARPMTMRSVGVEEELLRRCRSLAAEVAGRAGARIAALGTSPAPVLPQLVREGRYLEMARAFGLTAHEQLTCGCHVHVEISSADEGVAVLDRIRPWLPVLLALSANSPFWQGRDSEYASFRYQAWGRWPSAGPTEAFGTAEVLQGNGAADGRQRHAARHRHGVFRRPPVRALPDAGDSDRRRVPVRRRRGAHRRAVPGSGRDRGAPVASGRGRPAPAHRDPAPRRVAG